MTLEEHVAYTLLEHYRTKPAVDVISFHPPSGKAYETPLVRFPILKNSGSGASKRRHLDFIVRAGRYLILQELKGDAAGLSDDFLKLDALHQEYDLDRLMNTLAKRVPRVRTGPTIDRVLLSVGYSTDNGTIPERFTGFKVSMTKQITVRWGNTLSRDEIGELGIVFRQT